MNRKSLCVLIGLSLTAATAQAQDFDDRWYFAPWIGYYHNDSDRDVDDGSLYGSIGIGKYITPGASIDVFIDRTTRDRKPSPPLADNHWDQNGIGVSLRQRFGDGAWKPYVMGGVGFQHVELDGGGEDDWVGFAQVGAGLQYDWTERVNFRTELAYRQDWDDNSLPGQDDFGDWMLNLGLEVALGEAEAPVEVVEEEPAPAPAVPVDDCSTKDDDGDGVNNCDDKCPATPSGQVVGPDGCPQDVVIDLRGVEFKFDRPTSGETDIGPSLKEPSSEGLAVLDQAIDVLNRYPQVRVEVAGHTDAVGTDAYNQGLSERRARIVYDYLTSHGVDAGRLAGPNGYGEGRPIDTNDTSEGRQRNRRTELVVEGK